MIGLRGAEQAYDPSLSALERLYVRILGVPASGLRIRLRHVLPETRGEYRMILDAGCGIGVFAMELAKLHPEAEVVGLDMEEELVVHATRIAQHAGLENCRFIQGDVTDLGMSERFDLVVSVDNLEHIPNDETAMLNLYNVLKPGGKLVAHVPAYYRRWPVWRKRVNFDVPGHVRPGYHADDLEGKLRGCGFSIETLRPTYGFIETLCNNLSYSITGADRRRKHLYALIFPLLLISSYFGQYSRPKWGAGLLATGRRPGSSSSGRV